MTLLLLGRRQDDGCPSQWADARERVPPDAIARSVAATGATAVWLRIDSIFSRISV